MSATIRKRAPSDGTCSKCHQPYSRGERVVWHKPMHEFCDPGAFVTLPAAQSLEQIRLHALVALEDALLTMGGQIGVTPAMEKAFDRFQKLKAVALRPGTPGEALVALRMALIDGVKLVF